MSSVGAGRQKNQPEACCQFFRLPWRLELCLELMPHFADPKSVREAMQQAASRVCLGVLCDIVLVSACAQLLTLNRNISRKTNSTCNTRYLNTANTHQPIQTRMNDTTMDRQA